jgi:CBS domain-containing protein
MIILGWSLVAAIGTSNATRLVALWTPRLDADQPAAGVEMLVKTSRDEEAAMTMRKMSEIVRHQNPVILSQDTTVKHACICMRDAHVGAVLVIDKKENLVGIFTGRDVVARVAAAGRDSATTRLRDVMTPEPYIMVPNKTAIDALRLMQECGFRHVPVVDNGRLLGVVSRGDFRGLEQDRLEEETLLWEHM